MTWKPIIKWHADVGLRIGPIDQDQSENLATVFFLALSPIILWYPNEFQLVVHASIGIMCTYLINYETNKERGKKSRKRIVRYTFCLIISLLINQSSDILYPWQSKFVWSLIIIFQYLFEHVCNACMHVMGVGQMHMHLLYLYI